MAENNNVYIDVEVRAKSVQQELAELTAQIARLKDEQNRLNKQQKDLARQQNFNEKAQKALNEAYQRGEVTSEEYNNALAVLKQQQQALSDAALANAADLAQVGTTLQLTNKAMSDAKMEAKALATEMNGSVESMRAQLNALLRQYDALPVAERNAAAGQDLQKKIQDLTAAISEQEQATGRFERNVGNYQSIWEASSEKLEGFGGVLAKIFGENSVITQSVKRVAGFGRTLQDLSNQAPQAASAMNAQAQAAANVGDQTQQAQRRTIGFATASQQAAGASAQAGAASQQQAAGAASVAAGAKTAAAGLKSMTAAALRFIATPIGMILAAIAAAIAIAVAGFMQLKKAIERNDDAATALDSLKARFKVLGDIIKQVFNAAVKLITPVIEGVSKLAGAIMSLIPGVRELAEAEEYVVRAGDDLEEQQRRYRLMTAQTAKELSQLKIIYQDSTKSAKEREKALRDAIEIEKQNAKEALRLAKIELQIEEAKLKASGDTSDAAKNRLTELQAAVSRAEAAIVEVEADATRKLSSFRKQQQDEAKAAAAAAKKRAEDALKAQQERAKKLQDLQRKNTEARIAALRDEYLRTAMQARQAYDVEVAELNMQLQEQQRLIKQHQANTGSEQYRNAVAQAEALTQALKLKAEQLAAAIVDIAKRREHDIATLQRSNAELRVSMMEEGRDKILAIYELQRRDLAEATMAEQEAYRRQQEDLKALRDEGKISLEDYNRELDALAVKQAEQAERRALQREQITLSEAKALAQLNADETSKALKAISDKYGEQMASLKGADLSQQQAVLEAKKSELQALYDTLAGMDEAQAVQVFGSLDAWRAKLKEIKDAYTSTGEAIAKNNERIATATEQAMTKATNAVATLAKQMADYYAQRVEQIIGDNETLTEAQKAEALRNLDSQYAATMASIILQQASGIASTYAAGAKAMAETVGGPAVKIASMVAVVTSGLATLLSGIMSAKTATAQWQEQKAKVAAMAQGGLVQGAGTATSDSIPAKLSNGESVLTARATAAHYDTLSRWNVEGGGRPFPGALPAPPSYHFAQGGVAVDYRAMADVMREAVSEVQPVVSVKEITRVANRVKIKETQLR